MAMQFRRSVLFDHFSGTTTQQLELEALIKNYKQKLNLNSLTTLSSERSIPSSQSLRSSSRASSNNSINNYQTIEGLNARQARSIENLARKVKTVSLHKVLRNFDRERGLKQEREELEELKNPERRLERPSRGKQYRFQKRSKKGSHLQESIRKNLMQYFERKPEQEMDIQSILMRKKGQSEMNSRRSSLRLRSTISRS